MVEIATLPMEIRGYGPVKDAAVDKVMTKIGTLRSRLPQPAYDSTRSHNATFRG
jgi:indolepyruvate ferredoxin oxidoreductase